MDAAANMDIGERQTADPPTHHGAVRLANAPLHSLKHFMFGCGGTFRTPSLWSCDGPAKDYAWGSKIFFLELLERERGFRQ